MEWVSIRVRTTWEVSLFGGAHHGFAVKKERANSAHSRRIDQFSTGSGGDPPAPADCHFPPPATGEHVDAYPCQGMLGVIRRVAGLAEFSELFDSRGWGWRNAEPESGDRLESFLEEVLKPFPRQGFPPAVEVVVR